MIEEGDMKHKTILGLIMILIGLGLMICAGVAAAIFNFQHIDMTQLRQFIENPAPTIVTIIGYIMATVGISIVKYK